MNNREFRRLAIDLVDQAATEIAAILEKMWRGTDREKDLALAEADLVDHLLVAVQEWCNETTGEGAHYSDNHLIWPLDDR